jgi:hypothetical protein
MIFSHYVPIISQKNKQQIHGLFSPTSNEQWPKPWWIMPKPQSVPLKSLKETHFPIAGGCQRRDFILSFIHSFFIQSVSHSVMQPFSHSVSDKSLSFLHSFVSCSFSQVLLHSFMQSFVPFNSCFHWVIQSFRQQWVTQSRVLSVIHSIMHSFVHSSIEFVLVGGLEHFLCFHILGIIIPFDFQIFQRSRYTTNQVYLYIHSLHPPTHSVSLSLDGPSCRALWHCSAHWYNRGTNYWYLYWWP